MDLIQVEAFRVAVDEVGLVEIAAPADSVAVHRAAGKIHGFDAELAIGGRGWHQISVWLAVPSLPAGLWLGPRPRGRGQEDFHLGVARDSGVPRFDAHHAVFGSREALQAHADRIDRALLDFMTACFDPSLVIVISTTELRLSPGTPSLPWTSPTSPRWPCDSGALIRTWRAAEHLVMTGRDVGVFAPAGAR